MHPDRPLVVSHALAGALGAGWGVFVAIAPPTDKSITLVRAEEIAAVEVEFRDERAPEEPRPEPERPSEPPRLAPERTPPRPEPARASEAARKAEEAFGDAFGGAAPTRSRGMVGDVSNVLRGVAVAKGDGGADPASGAAGGKRVIAYGKGGEGERTAGRGYDPSVTKAAAAIGTVSGVTASVGKASISVAAPEAVRAAGAPPPGREVARLGTFVRSRQRQLQLCYERQGLAADPALAGTLAIEVNLAADGTVMGARVTRRTWSGPGAAEAEACIVERVSEWTFPASSGDVPEKYAFSFVFAK